MLILAALLSLIVIICGFFLLYTVYFRFLKLLFIVPIGSIAYSTMSGNRMVAHTAVTYSKYFLSVAYEYMSYIFKQNFIKYMEEDVLKNWGATLGFSGSNLKPAVCILEFAINDILDFDVHVPAGTVVTAGDDVYFSTNDSCVIKTGETSIQAIATCTKEGSAGNGYMPGQLNIMTEPVLNISSVSNIDISAGESVRL